MKYTMKLSVFLHYDSAVFAVIVCLRVRLSVCLSVTSWYWIETTGRIQLIFAWASFSLSHTVL